MYKLTYDDPIIDGEETSIVNKDEVIRILNSVISEFKDDNKNGVMKIVVVLDIPLLIRIERVEE